MRSLSGSARTDRCGVNFCKYWTIPRNICISFLFSGCFIFTIASIFLGSGFLPLCCVILTKECHFMFLVLKLLEVEFYIVFCAVWNNLVSARSWSLWSSLYPTTIISSAIHITCFSLPNILSSFHWNTSPTTFTFKWHSGESEVSKLSIESS